MIGFVGFGRMGSALAKGAIASKVLKPQQIVAFDTDPNIQAGLKQLKINQAKHALDVVREVDIIFLCVKPQVMKETVLPIALQADPRVLRKKCFVSIAAGIPLDRLETWLGESVSVFRVMPNTPALLQTGMSGISRGRFGNSIQEKRIKQILSSVGEVVTVSEKWMDAVTAVSGSGPAYVFYLAEALIEAARKIGLDQTTATLLVQQTICGAGAMLIHRPEPVEELRRQVTSPGGTTAAAIHVFEKKKLKSIVQQAVLAAKKRSAELAKGC